MSQIIRPFIIGFYFITSVIFKPVYTLKYIPFVDVVSSVHKHTYVYTDCKTFMVLLGSCYHVSYKERSTSDMKAIAC